MGSRISSAGCHVDSMLDRNSPRRASAMARQSSNSNGISLQSHYISFITYLNFTINQYSLDDNISCIFLKVSSWGNMHAALPSAPILVFLKLVNYMLKAWNINSIYILIKRFARKTVKHPAHKKMFKLKIRNDTRSTAPIIIPKAKRKRYMNSAVPSLARIIVENNFKWPIYDY